MSDDSSDEKERPLVAKTAVDLQRLKLMKLMKNPEKPVIIPERPKVKGTPSVPEFVRNVMGSSAGAGSGEFHVYRHLRRKEYSRQKYIQEKSQKELLDEEFHRKLEENKKLAEEMTAKKRAKRLKKKQNMKKKKFKPNQQSKSNQGNSSESDDDESSDEDKCTSTEIDKEANEQILKVEAKSEYANIVKDGNQCNTNETSSPTESNSKVDDNDKAEKEKVESESAVENQDNVSSGSKTNTSEANTNDSEENSLSRDEKNQTENDD